MGAINVYLPAPHLLDKNWGRNIQCLMIVRFYLIKENKMIQN
jgi:hypothetical protein